MKSRIIAANAVQSEPKRIFHCSFTIVKVVTVLGALFFISWVLTRIVSALFTLLFSLALESTPEKSFMHFPVATEAEVSVEVYSISQEPGSIADGRFFYAVDQKDSGNEGGQW